MGTKLTLAAILTGLAIGSSAGRAQSDEGVSGMHDVESGFIEVDNGQLYYEKTGSGTTMVLLHDGLIHHEVWNHQVAAWRDRFTLVRYDRRGFGKSPTPTDRFSEVADLLAVFDALTIDSAIIVGMSAGGRLAIDFALEHPARATHLVLVGAVVSGMPYTDHFITRGGHLPDDIHSDPARYIDYWINTDPYEIWSGSDQARVEARELLTAYPNNVDAANFQLMLPPPRLAFGIMNEINIPTLVVTGEYDTPDVQAHAGAISAAISGAERIVLNNAGHRVPMEQPDALSEAVLTFLTQAKFFQTLRQVGVAEAVDLFHREREVHPDEAMFSEARINQLGYQYLLGGKVDDAVRLFEIYVEAFPGSFNAFDSYAEALLASGDTTGAIVNYEKSVELNPDNANGVAVLGRLRGTD